LNRFWATFAKLGLFLWEALLLSEKWWNSKGEPVDSEEESEKQVNGAAKN
jgi:hypothetical protein